MLSNIKPELKKLQVTGLEGIDSIKECMDDNNPNPEFISREKDNLTHLEDKFSKKLAEYNEVYRQISESQISNNNIDKNIQKYLGKIVTFSEGNFSYINDFGFTHKFSNETWSKKNQTCKSNPLNIDKIDYNKFKAGPNMGVSQPCGLAGKNVKNIKTGEFGWVDKEGYLHIYPQSLWDKKADLCESNYVELSNSDFISFPQGSPIESTDICLDLKIDPNLIAKLESLNQELLDIKNEIFNKISHLANVDKKIIHQYNQLLNNDDNMISIPNNSEYNKEIINLDGKMEDSSLTLNMERIHKFAWIFHLIAIFFLLMHAINGPQSKFMDIIALIAAIYLLYVICSWIWNLRY